MLRFSLFGFPITIHWMFWLVGVLLSGTAFSGNPLAFKLTLAWMVVFFVSILWHELGHAFAFRHYGQRPQIVLYGMGGYARGDAPLTRKQDIIVSLAGPFAGFFLGLVVWLTLRAYPMLFQGKPVMMHFVVNMLWINVIWSAVNLLPVLPLDGGRVCAAVLSGGKAALVPKIGMITAIAMAALGLAYQQIFVALLFGFLAYQNWQRSQHVYGKGGGGPFDAGRGSGRGF